MMYIIKWYLTYFSTANIVATVPVACKPVTMSHKQLVERVLQQLTLVIMYPLLVQ